MARSIDSDASRVFRVSQFMQELSQPTPLAGRRDSPGPVVIWNLIRRCNLTCQHCYSISADVDFPGELSTEELFAVMDDLKAFGVPVLILSGGEPLLRPDLFEVAARAKLQDLAKKERATLAKEGMKFHDAPNGKAYLDLAINSAYDRMMERLKKAGRPTAHVATLRAAYQE